jgi:hypothetical protein
LGPICIFDFLKIFLKHALYTTGSAVLKSCFQQQGCEQQQWWYDSLARDGTPNYTHPSRTDLPQKRFYQYTMLWCDNKKEDSGVEDFSCHDNHYQSPAQNWVEKWCSSPDHYMLKDIIDV